MDPSLKSRLKLTTLVKTNVNQNANFLMKNENLACHGGRLLPLFSLSVREIFIEHLLHVWHYSPCLWYIRKIHKTQIAHISVELAHRFSEGGSACEAKL